MLLPIRTTREDISAVCEYLMTKPMGATLPEAKAVVDSKRLDARKRNSLKYWGIIDEDDGRMRITDRGRRFVGQSGSSSKETLQEVVREVPPYHALIERVAHRREETLAATDVAAYWYDHFGEYVSESEKILNDQAVCFLQIAEGAGFGTLIIGRRSKPTRFEFDIDSAREFVDVEQKIQPVLPTDPETIDDYAEQQEDAPEESGVHDSAEEEESGNTTSKTNRVFITHGKNHKILEQVKEIVTFGQREPVVAMERETAAKPIPLKVMDEMKTCDAAVIHVDIEEMLLDSEGNKVPKINENVLIEIGAAMALYGEKFVLLVEDGITLPSNLQGLYKCRYKGGELNMEATMKLLKAFNEF